MVVRGRRRACPHHAVHLSRDDSVAVDSRVVAFELVDREPPILGDSVAVVTSDAHAPVGTGSGSHNGSRFDLGAGEEGGDPDLKYDACHGECEKWQAMQILKAVRQRLEMGEYWGLSEDGDRRARGDATTNTFDYYIVFNQETIHAIKFDESSNLVGRSLPCAPGPVFLAWRQVTGAAKWINMHYAERAGR